MPNNMEGRGLTDREMVQLCLELEKGRCRSLSNTMLEVSHEPLRKIYGQCLESSSDGHYRLFNLLNDKGWYMTEAATAAQIGKVQELMQNNLHPDDQF
ncbi:spore coat protein [Evansella clarkii]|jgi:spore coat protein CotF|uniref:spore coat protein n=1 Tax=Evansella clarkii TaxID=79879 RepID=UPI0009965B8B|nr:spore coat protein [Evansella clarkii]